MVSDPEFIQDVSVLQTTDRQLVLCCNYKSEAINLAMDLAECHCKSHSSDFKNELYQQKSERNENEG